MPDVTYLLLDVFTDTPFVGNPLAVALDPPDLTDAQMATVARELNLSETIFVRPAGRARWSTRIFTPGRELPFAGHPTVGAAVALAATGRLEGTDELVLAEVAGDVAVVVERTDPPRATFTAPVAPRPVAAPSAASLDDLYGAVGLTAADALPGVAPGLWSAGVTMLVLPVASLDALGRARPDVAALDRLAAAGWPAEVYLLAPDGERWRARMFAPGSGITEDPATGSAACAAAGLLASLRPDGPASWHIVQGVEMGRRSDLFLTAEVRDGATDRATLGGAAVLVGEGRLRFD